MCVCVLVRVSTRAFPIDIAFCFVAAAVAASQSAITTTGGNGFRECVCGRVEGGERKKTRTPRAHTHTPTLHKRIYHAKSFATVISTSLTAHAATPSSSTQPTAEIVERRRRLHSSCPGKSNNYRTYSVIILTITI